MAFHRNLRPSSGKKAAHADKNELLFCLVDGFLIEEWSGTATELCDALKAIGPAAEIYPNTITARLEVNGLFKEKGIVVKHDRSGNGRAITLTRQGENPIAE